MDSASRRQEEKSGEGLRKGTKLDGRNQSSCSQHREMAIPATCCMLLVLCYIKCVCACTHINMLKCSLMSRLDASLRESDLSFHHMGPKTWTQVVWLWWQALDLQSHLISRRKELNCAKRNGKMDMPVTQFCSLWTKYHPVNRHCYYTQSKKTNKKIICIFIKVFFFLNRQLGRERWSAILQNSAT